MIDILFPEDFEKAYNRLHQAPAYIGGSEVGAYPLMNQSAHRSSVRKEEQIAAVRRSLVDKQKGQVKGGSLQTPEARKLLPKMLKRRAEDYRRIDQIASALEEPAVAAPEAAPAGSPSEVLARELDTKLRSLLSLASVGNISSDVAEVAGQIVGALNAKGNILNESQLKALYDYLPDINEYISRRLRLAEYREPTAPASPGVEGAPPVPAPAPAYELRRTAEYTTLLVNVIGRQIRAILSKVNEDPKARALFQREVRRASDAYIKQKIALLAPTGRPGRPRLPGAVRFESE